MKKLITGGAVALATVGLLAGANPGIAHADNRGYPDDQNALAYMAELNEHGIPLDDAQQARRTAISVCTTRAGGYYVSGSAAPVPGDTEAETINAVYVHHVDLPAMSMDTAAVVVQRAEYHFCSAAAQAPDVRGVGTPPDTRTTRQAVCDALGIPRGPGSIFGNPCPN
jgi:hypothetical protein